MIDYSNEYKPRQKQFYKYVIVLKMMHGDADFYTYPKCEFRDGGLESFEEHLNFFFKVRNFGSNTAYENLGYYYPIKERKQLLELAEKYLTGYPSSSDALADLIEEDKRYRNSESYAEIEEIQVWIDGIRREVLDMDARNTNLISLPKIGDQFVCSMGHLRGTGDPWSHAIGYQKLEKMGVPLMQPNKNNEKDKLDQKNYTLLNFTVEDIKLDAVYDNYDVWNILLKLDKNSTDFPNRVTSFDDLDNIKPTEDIYLTTSIRGHDPNYVRN
jgi:hypothetical protein